MGKNQNYNQIGKDIEEALSEGLASGNWTRLSNTITDSVDTVLDDVGKKISSIADVANNATNLSEHKEAYSNGAYTRKRQEQLNKEKEARRARQAAEIKAANEARMKQQQESLQKAKKNQVLVPMNYVGKYSSTINTVVGGMGLGITGVSLVSAIPKLIFGSISLGGISVGLGLLVVFGVVLNKGINDGKRLKLAERFATLCGSKGYIEIENLANSTGMKTRRVLRNIRRMFKLGFFPQGHLDDDNKNLILTDKVYEQYKETKRNSIQSAEVYDTTAREVDDEQLSSEENAELKQMIAEGNDYITKLHNLNDKIPGEVITAKLSRLEGLLTEIFSMVKVHPEQMSRMHELMDYYLPTMLKLVTAYEEYDRISEPGEDIIEAKKDIENTLDTINVAFRKLLNNLFKDSVWDVTTDAQVLKTVLAQKGLSQDMEGE